jgi:hypothetical protein
MSLFKKLALATALGVAFLGSPAVQATELDNIYILENTLVNLPGVYDQYYPISNALGSVGTSVGGVDTFVDDYLLQIFDTETFYLTLQSDLSGTTPDVKFASVTMYDFNGAIYPFAFQTASDTSFFASGLTLHSGLYDLEITGDFKVDSGTYEGALSTIAPVPEPAQWAMMVLGLGVLGVFARRRRAD